MALAEDLGPEQARAFVVGKLFTYTCFEGTSGAGRIFADGSVVGTIKFRGQGQTRFATLPAGTVTASGGSMCAHLSGLPITPCFRVEKTSYHSFRGSLSGLGFAYCDFYQRNPRSELSKRAERSERSERSEREPEATPIASPRTELVSKRPEPHAEATPIANSRPALRPSLAE
ncbi:MAG TPA: hypothetical protein VMC05_01450 [Xanthobacteraceae bacterium]|nr:hypothetical protein [Xanthobacteraceae bacterium]